MSKNSKLARKYITAIRIIIITFIALGMVIGFLNSVLIHRLDESSQNVIHIIYQIFENIIRTIVVIVGGYLTISRLKILNRKVSSYRKYSLLMFSISAIVLLIIIPYSLDFFGFIMLYLPFPWYSTPFQILNSGEIFSYSFVDRFGATGIQLAIFLYIVFQIIFFLGTFIYGRRWFCSLICPLNGCHAESFGDALPFIKHDKERPNSKAINKKVWYGLILLKIIFFILNICIMIIWILYLISGIEIIPIPILIDLELYKYLIFEMYLMLIGWILIGSRSYCYYCPAGTLLGIIGRCVGQQITTGLTKCIECGKCNDACKMSIDIKSFAIRKQPVMSFNCVGCGLCIEACPENNLEYSTYLINRKNRN